MSANVTAGTVVRSYAAIAGAAASVGITDRWLCTTVNLAGTGRAR